VVRLWQVLVSLRTTAVLLAVFSFLLLLNVVLPQRAVDPVAHLAAVRSGALARFVLVTLGLGDVASSPPFLAALAALFLNLAAVLFDRVGTTLRRIRFAPPSDEQVRSLLRGEALSLAASTPFSLDRATETLARMGYRAVLVGERTIWGVKHRRALLGFAVFHASFFLMLLGGLLLYVTRDVVMLVGAEGATLDSRMGRVVRRAPAGPPSAMQLTIGQVEVRLAGGKPVDLAVTLTMEGEGPALSRVNHPARWRSVTALVEQAGIAPVLRLTDSKGFTVDHVVVSTAAPNGLPTRLELAGGDAIEVVVEPIPLSDAFPMREALSTTPVSIRVLRRGAKLFDGQLRSGGSLALGDRALHLEELRYWTGLRLVSERGGPLLIAGFVFAVVGTVWRMFWYRREVVAEWSEHGLVVAGRCEFFPTRFRDELAEVGRLLGGDARQGGSPA
jgi:hypothetical protein